MDDDVEARCSLIESNRTHQEPRDSEMKFHHVLLMLIAAAAPLGAQTTVSGVIDVATV